MVMGDSKVQESNYRVLKLLGGQLTIEPRENYLFIWHGRAARDAQELKPVLRGMAQMLMHNHVQRILFDSRDSDYTPPEVQTLLWNWLENAQLEKVGTLVESKNLAVSLRMTGLSKKIVMRAFDRMSTAEAWMSR